MTTLLRFLGLFLLLISSKIQATVALDGYDPVTYFEEKKPLKGSSEIAWIYKKKNWYFINARNKKKFQKNPQKYAPQYDGYCGWALLDGRLSPGLAQYWVITNDKLYLLCSEEMLEKWKAHLHVNIRKANEEWKKRAPSN